MPSHSRGLLFGCVPCILAVNLCKCAGCSRRHSCARCCSKQALLTALALQIAAAHARTSGTAKHHCCAHWTTCTSTSHLDAAEGAAPTISNCSKNSTGVQCMGVCCRLAYVHACLQHPQRCCRTLCESIFVHVRYLCPPMHAAGCPSQCKQRTAG